MGFILTVICWFYAVVSTIWEILSRRAETVVPSLPDDIHFMIFGELTTEERSSLATSCKRFRTIDFDLGKKSFHFIKIEWATAKQYVNMQAPNAKYRIQGEINSPIPLLNQNRKLIRQAHTQSFDVVIGNQLSNFNHQENQLFIMFAQSVQYEKLRVFINSEQDMSENIIIPTLLMNRNLEKSQVFLSYKSSRASHNILRIREFLMQLPKIDMFRFSWKAHSPLDLTLQDEQVLNDETLFNIASQTNHAELTMGEFTVQGIIDVFELVCTSDLDTKYIEIYVQPTTIDDLLASGFVIALGVRIQERTGYRWIIDYQRTSAMIAQNKEGICLIYMFKIEITEDHGGFSKYRCLAW